MTYSIRSADGVIVLDGRAFALSQHHIAIFRGVLVGVAAAATGALVVAAFAFGAAWMAAASLDAKSALRATVPMALETAAPSRRQDRLPIAANVPRSPRVLIVRDDPEDSDPDTQQADDPALTYAPTVDVSLFSKVPLQPATAAPPPQPAELVTASLPPAPAPEAAAVAPPPAAAAPTKRARLEDARNDSVSLPDRGSRTAVYDISAHAVYLPNGTRLEAHSGLGSRIDDPRYVSAKNRGPTPPNVYELTLREQLFHGVRALRLNPVGDGNMYGRDGILAHTYMLGPSGQSNGCVSFSNYPAFLNAFLRGEVERLVVVARLAGAPGRAAHARPGQTDRYASNNQ